MGENSRTLMTCAVSKLCSWQASYRALGEESVSYHDIHLWIGKEKASNYPAALRSAKLDEIDDGLIVHL